MSVDPVVARRNGSAVSADRMAIARRIGNLDKSGGGGPQKRAGSGSTAQSTGCDDGMGGMGKMRRCVGRVHLLHDRKNHESTRPTHDSPAPCCTRHRRPPFHVCQRETDADVRALNSPFGHTKGLSENNLAVFRANHHTECDGYHEADEVVSAQALTLRGIPTPAIGHQGLTGPRLRTAVWAGTPSRAAIVAFASLAVVPRPASSRGSSGRARTTSGRCSRDRTGCGAAGKCRRASRGPEPSRSCRP